MPTKPDSASPRTRVLLDQVAWFDRLRFWAAAGMVVLSLTAAYVLGFQLDLLPLLTIAAVTVFLNLVYRIWIQTRLQPDFASVRRHVELQIALDLLLLTALLHYSGGVASPFVFFFLFHTFIATLLRSVAAGLRVAFVSLVLMATVGSLELTNAWPPSKTGMPVLSASAGWIGFSIWVLVFGFTLLISVYFVGTVLRQVRSRDEQLRRLNQQLGQSEKLASIGTLAAGVAHEINNPVGVIRNKTQILRYRIQDADEPPMLLQELDTIEKHTKRVSSITEGLLQFSKETPFELKRQDLNQLAREAGELVRVPYDDAEVGLSLGLAPRPVLILGSANHLLQVIINILLNARDASEPGDRVVVATGAREDEAVLEIRDQGSGIEDQVLSKIFDPFFTTKDVDRGTGLGLAISHGIVERHRGWIEVDSEPGRGSVFRIVLPLAGAAA